MIKIKNLKNLIVNEKKNYQHALKILNKSEKKVCFVVNSKNKLKGVITDGDLRRNFLKKKSLIECGEICSKRYLYSVNTHIDKKLYKKAKLKNIKYVPVVDKKGFLLGIHTIPNQYNNMIDTPMVIMAGGVGKRLRPFTIKTPKPLITVGDGPLIDEIIRNAKLSGIRKIYISVNYLKKKIFNYIKKKKFSNINVEFINENKPLGTAGSLRNLNKFKLENFIVSNGDVFTSLDYSDALNKHLSEKNIITICIKEKLDQIKYGVIKLKNKKIIKIEEKPINKYFINAGIYILNKNIFNFIKNNEKIDMPKLIDRILSKNKKVGFFKIKNFWIDIGNKSDLELARDFVKNVK